LDLRSLLIREVCARSSLLLRLRLWALALSRLVLDGSLLRILLSLPLLTLPLPRTSWTVLVLTLVASTGGLFTLSAVLALIALLGSALPRLALSTLVRLTLFALVLATWLRLTLFGAILVLISFTLTLPGLATRLIATLGLAFLLTATLLRCLRRLPRPWGTLTAGTGTILRCSNSDARHQSGCRQ
jgi:hypothetical protein